MSYDPVRLSIPGASLVAMTSKRYETLDDDFIQQWMYELLLNYRVSPEYLLLSAEARQTLYQLLMTSMYPHWWHYTGENESGEPREVYPNRAAGTLLTLVVFPGLPAKTLYAASLLRLEEERTYRDGKVETRYRIVEGI